MKQFRFLFLITAGCFSCHSQNGTDRQDFSHAGWNQVLQLAKGKTVQMMMWRGDPLINAYMNNYVVPAVKEKLGIELKITGGQGNTIVAIAMKEIEAGKKRGDIDICWINGETFYQLRQIHGLYGPFVNRLPNAANIDFNNPFIKYDFQKHLDDMECPWGNVQFCIIYNSAKVPDPPRNRAQLEEYVRTHPGTFTIGTDFTGLTFLKSLLIDIAGGKEVLNGPFDEVRYKKYSAILWEYINRIKPYFWKQGKTFPNAVAQMHQLFSQGELYFTMSNNDGEVDNKVAQGIFPAYSRAYVPDFGSIQNSHYLGIMKNSGEPAAAMAVINFMISPEAQLQKQRSSVWGDGTVLNQNKLSAGMRDAFDSLQSRKYGPGRSSIQSRALMELDPEYMIRLNDDFRKYVIEQ